MSLVMGANDREAINLYKAKILEQYKKKAADVDVFKRIDTPTGESNSSPKKEKKGDDSFLDKLNVCN